MNRHALVLASFLLPLVACSSSGPDGGPESDGGASGTSSGEDTEGGTTGDTDPGSAPTYYQHVKPILDARCVGCHFDGGVGPFPLDDYAHAEMWGPAAAVDVAARVMPPFPPDDTDCHPIRDFRNMEDWERDLVVEWNERGREEGDPDAPVEVTVDVPPPELGEPSRIFPGPQAYVPNTSEGDEYRCFLIDPGLTADWTFLQSVGIDTNNWSRVHHAIIYSATPDQVAAAQAVDAETAEPGWPCYFSPGVDGLSPVGFYSPGAQQQAFAGGTSVPVEAGTQFVVEGHFHDTYNTEPASIDVAIWEFDQPVTEFPHGMNLIDTSWVIPAGEESFSVVLEGEFIEAGGAPGPGQAVEGLIWGVDMHMHLLGKTAKIELVRANGDRECLMWVPAWTDDWQGSYALETPVAVMAGDRIEATCEWDNSAGNQPVINGEKQQPKDVYFGLDVYDEMCTANLSMSGG